MNLTMSASKETRGTSINLGLLLQHNIIFEEKVGVVHIPLMNFFQFKIIVNWFILKHFFGLCLRPWPNLQKTYVI